MGRAYRIFASGLALCLSACVVPVDVHVGGSDDGAKDDAIVGSGHRITQTRPVHSFRAVQVSGVGRVVIHRTGKEALAVTGEDNILTHLESEVRGGTLFIGPEAGVSLSPTQEVLIEIEADRLDGIEGLGAVAFEAHIGAQDSFRVSLAGVCAATAEGSVEWLEVEQTGVTGFRGFALTARRAVVNVSGVSWAEIHVTDRLDASASGVSAIHYAGNPKEVHAHASGTSSVGPG